VVRPHEEVAVPGQSSIPDQAAGMALVGGPAPPADDAAEASRPRRWTKVAGYTGGGVVVGGTTSSVWLTNTMPTWLVATGITVVAVLVGVVVMTLLAVTIAWLVSALSTCQERQRAAHQALHLLFAFLTANLQRRPELISIPRMPSEPFANAAEETIAEADRADTAQPEPSSWWKRLFVRRG
jgi:hypothetical protein